MTSATFLIITYHVYITLFLKRPGGVECKWTEKSFRWLAASCKENHPEVWDSLLGSSESYMLTWVGLLKPVTRRKATKSRSRVCFSTVRSTLAADLTWPHWETTAAYEIKAIETEHEQYVARCSPSLSLLQPWATLDLVYSVCQTSRSPGVSRLLLRFLLCKGRIKVHH